MQGLIDWAISLKQIDLLSKRDDHKCTQNARGDHVKFNDSSRRDDGILYKMRARAVCYRCRFSDWPESSLFVSYVVFN